MWVYVYKFDKHGRFNKCKARLVVRGDQQIKSIHEETYAATLAGRSFRTLIAIAARFDLELIQEIRWPFGPLLIEMMSRRTI